MRDFLKGTVTPKDWMAVAGILGLTALITAGFYFVAIAKQNEKIAALKESNALVMTDLREAQNIDQRIDALRAETENIKLLVSEFEQRLPSSREIPNLLSEFEAMEAEQDLDVEFSPRDRVLDEFKETIPYAVVAKGNFHNVATFINKLERFKRFLKITDLRVQSIENGQVQAQFTLNTYRFIQSSAEGDKA
jgi:Tfp pilus assembly protein PilO